MAERCRSATDELRGFKRGRPQDSLEIPECVQSSFDESSNDLKARSGRKKCDGESAADRTEVRNDRVLTGRRPRLLDMRTPGAWTAGRGVIHDHSASFPRDALCRRISSRPSPLIRFADFSARHSALENDRLDSVFSSRSFRLPISAEVSHLEAGSAEWRKPCHSTNRAFEPHLPREAIM